MNAKKSLIISFFLIVLPLHLEAQPSYNDFIILKNEKIIPCNLIKFYKNTVVFTRQKENESAALFAVRTIRMQELSVVYLDHKGYIYSVDTLNTVLARRYGVVDETMPVAKNGKTFINQETDPGKFELSVAVGALTTGQWINIFKDIITVTGSLGHVTTKEYDRTQFLISYHYFLPKSDLSLGIDFSYENYTEHILVDGEKAGSLKTNYKTFAFAVSYNWLDSEYLQLYSAAGLGAMFVDYASKGPVIIDSPNTIYPNFNLTLLGFKVGHRLFLMGELGGGYRGLFTIGLAYQF